GHQWDSDLGSGDATTSSGSRRETGSLSRSRPKPAWIRTIMLLRWHGPAPKVKPLLSLPLRMRSAFLPAPQPSPSRGEGARARCRLKVPSGWGVEQAISLRPYGISYTDISWPIPRRAARLRVGLSPLVSSTAEASGFSTTCSVATIERDSASAWTRAAILTVWPK